MIKNISTWQEIKERLHIWRITDVWKKARERLHTWVVWHLPKSICYWAMIRVISFASVECCPDKSPDELTYREISDCWLNQ